jgi:hypothetical protein
MMSKVNTMYMTRDKTVSWSAISRGCLLAASLFLAHSAQASDFFDGNKARDLSRGSLIEQGTTIGGYPIYAGDGGWRFIASTVTGPTPRGGYFGRVQLIHPHAGNYFAEMILDANLNRISGIYFTSDPCGGDFLVKRARYHIPISDCLKIEPQRVTIGGRQITILLITVSQQNEGRLYEIRMALNLETFGFRDTLEADWKKEEIARRPDRAKFIEIIGEWAKQLQDASVKAMGYGKTGDAFRAVPSFNQLREAVAGTSAPPSGPAVQSTPATRSQPGSAGTGRVVEPISERLRRLDRLLYERVITEEEYGIRRREILSAPLQ